MLKKLANILFSNRLTAVLFVAYALAMAVGTFMDQGQSTSPTPYSRNLIYNALWFEAIMVLLTINFIGNIFKYRLLRKEKWATLTLHLSFIFILLGAFITRYHGFEGVMSIREGATESTFLSQKTYLTMHVDGDHMVNGQLVRRVESKEVDFSPRLENKFKFKSTYGSADIEVKLIDFIPGAEKDIVPNPLGEFYLKLVEAGEGVPHNHFLKMGQVASIHNVLYALNKPTKGAINITYTDSTLTIKSPFQGQYMTMATGVQGLLLKDSVMPLKLRSRYIIGNQAVVFPKPVIKGVFDVVKKSELLKGDEDGLALQLSANGDTEIIKILGGKGINNPFEQISVGGLDFSFRYGSKVLELPFQIKLNDFIAERYPGTEKSYASFESKVSVLDSQGEDFDFHIYMNNILNHRGYRFFQSSFDPDEKGTILSVNHDYWGTLITYLGYFLLYFGLMAILFSKHTRFEELRLKLKKVKRKKNKILIIILCGFFNFIPAQDIHTREGHDIISPSKSTLDSILEKNIAAKSLTTIFGSLVIQDSDGRMKPVNTYGSELLRKLSKKDHYENFDANQVYLSMLESPQLWYNVPIIYLKRKKADTIRSLIGVDKDAKYAALIDFFDENLNYKLGPYLEEAYSAQPPTAIHKEFISADQRVNLLYNTLDGRSLKIFPIPENENNLWVSPKEYVAGDFVIKDTLYSNFVKTGFLAFLATLQNDKISDPKFTSSLQLLESIKKSQIRYGGPTMLSEQKINAELLYNKYDLFKNLFSWYMYASTLMFVLLIVQIFNDRSVLLNSSINVFKYAILFLFVLHTLALAIRWYISGHAPWSDAYESMIYVAWATMLFGVLFGRKSALTFAATAFVTSMILMIAHWNWMDPSIGNLQPVLNSYWLMIHVAVIVGSYGPFALSMILGLLCLFLTILTTESRKEKMDLNLREITIINEMSMTVGLVMLTIGNFLGGMWANESWGRYWGWDPKETWALISIMVYAFVLHMRLIPGLRGRLGFNIASILAFGSILMTYFGVNFYLAGLHSYAKDDQEISIQYIFSAIIILLLMSLWAFRKHRKFFKGKTI